MGTTTPASAFSTVAGRNLV